MSDADSSGSRRASPAPRGLGSKMARIFSSAASLKKDDVPPEPPKHFNPEEHISEKRQWTKRQQEASSAALKKNDAAAAAAASSSSLSSSTATQEQQSTSIPRMYEHFCIVGLPPTINVKAVSADIQTYQTARRASAAGTGGAAGASAGPSVGELIDIVPDTSDSGTKQYGIKGPVLSAQVLTTFPASPQLPEDLASNVAAFCFPHGVRPELLERTPSMSGLNEVVFGQPYQTQSDHSFVFRMSIADPGDPTPRPLYGVCCYARELVHRPPALARDSFPDNTAPLARYMVTAPRCYCLLTRYPFFDLHYRVLHTILGLERLERMSSFADEVALGLVTSTDGNSIMRYSSANDSITRNSTNINGTTSIGEDSYAALGIHRHYSTRTSMAIAPSPGKLTATTTTTASSSTATELTPTRTNAESSTTSSDDEDEGDDEEFCSRGGGLGIGPDTSTSTGFATPMHATTEEQEVEEEDTGEAQEILNKKSTGGSTNYLQSLASGSGGSKKKIVHLSRGLSEGTECEGLSPVASTSSLGSDLAATPSAPLLPSTPFYTPAPNSSLLNAASSKSRRMTKYHGAPSPGPDPLLLDPQQDEKEEDAGNAAATGQSQSQSQQEDLLGRMESVKQLLNDSLIELDTRLQTSPPVVPLQQQQGQNAVLENVDLLSSSLDLGNWVGATEVQEEKEPSNGSPSSIINGAPAAGINGLNDSFAALLTLTPPQSAAEEEVNDAGEEGTTPGNPNKEETTISTETRNKLDGIDVLQQYLNTAVPRPGESVGFQPDPTLHPIVYQRPAWISTLRDLGLRLDASALPDIDAAANLSAWTISALCQSLSLESILAFFSAVLLERQVVLFCPNVGVLCGVALSLVPLLLPFSWQSLLLPVLPATASRLDLLEAPVPFVVGVLFKTQEVRSRCGGLVRVNIYKDRVRNASSLPALPHAAALAEALAGPHAELQRAGRERAAAARPVHIVSEAQAALAQCFSSTLQKYLQALVADLRGYTITDVSEGSGEQQRVSVLLKESFLESFPPRDRAFMRQFAETQMFSVYCDSVLG